MMLTQMMVSCRTWSDCPVSESRAALATCGLESGGRAAGVQRACDATESSDSVIGAIVHTM